MNIALVWWIDLKTNHPNNLSFPLIWNRPPKSLTEQCPGNNDCSIQMEFPNNDLSIFNEFDVKMNQTTQVKQYISRSFPWKLIWCQMKKRSPLKRKSEWKLIGMDFIKLHWFGSQDVYGWLPARLLLYWPRVYWFDSLTNLSQRLSIGQN